MKPKTKIAGIIIQDGKILMKDKIIIYTDGAARKKSGTGRLGCSFD